MENKFITLNLAQQNRVSCTQDVSLLNNFENVLTNEVVWILMLFWKKKNLNFKGGDGMKEQKSFYFFIILEKKKEREGGGDLKILRIKLSFCLG